MIVPQHHFATLAINTTVLATDAAVKKLNASQSNIQLTFFQVTGVGGVKAVCG